MIFSKSLRRKDVKGVGKAKAKSSDEIRLPEIAVATNDPGGENQTDPLLEIESLQAPKAGAIEGDDEDFQKSRQSTINLVVSAFIICKPRILAYQRCKCRASMLNGSLTFPYFTLKSRSQPLN